MTVKITGGSTQYNGVTYIGKTSQDVIENVDVEFGERLIKMGVPVKVNDPPKPLQIFHDSPEKLRAKIAELESKLAEVEKEQAELLDDDLQDVAGIAKKIDLVNSRYHSLKLLLERQKIKLQKAEAAAQIENEKSAVKNLEKTISEKKPELKKILDGLLSDVAALETKSAALREHIEYVDRSYRANLDKAWNNCPLNRIALPAELKNQLDSLKNFVARDKELLELLCSQTTQELSNFFNSKKFKSPEELDREIRERERQEQLRREREKLGLTA